MKTMIASLMIVAMLVMSLSAVGFAKDNRLLVQTNGLFLETTEENRVFFIGTDSFGFGYRQAAAEVDWLGNIGVNIDGLFLSGYALKEFQEGLEARLGVQLGLRGSDVRFVGGVAYQF